MRQPYETVIITINAKTAEELNRTYQDECVRAFPWTANWSGRAKKVVVMPIPADWDKDLRKTHEQRVRECQARLIYQGELVRL